MDETEGDASDSSAFTNTGSLRWRPNLLCRQVWKCDYLDGTNDYIQAFTYNGIGGGTRRTIALWFKTSTANKPILEMERVGAATLYKLSLNSSGAAVFQILVVQAMPSQVPPPDWPMRPAPLGCHPACRWNRLGMQGSTSMEPPTR